MANIYEGSKPFVFISYAHKDTARVMPIVELLSSKGIRVWYDAGIEAGSEWPEYIASHLKACACMLCFISQGYDASDNCRRELTFALNYKRPSMSVYLEQCQLSDGLELQLGLVQAVFCNRFPSVELMTDHLITVPMVAACLATTDDAPQDYVIPVASTASQQAAEAEFLKNATIKNGVLEKYFGNQSEIYIPSSITHIGEQAFSYCKNLVSVTIPDSVVSIGKYAFSYCKALASVTIADSVISIGEGAFSGCEALTAAILPNRLARIEKWSFAFCESLATLSIPNSVTSIGRFAFGDCKSLTSLTIPDSVNAIEWDAFERCRALSSVTLPGRVSQISANPFTDCNNLKEFIITGEDPHFANKNGHLVDMRTKTLVAGCASSPIPEDGSVNIIGKAAFSYCSALTALVIPRGVSRIEDHAFAECTALVSVSLPEDLISIGNYAFSGDDVLASVTIPQSVTAIGYRAFSYCKSLFSINIPGNVIHMDANPFGNCKNLIEITVSPDNPNFVVKNGHLINTNTKTLISCYANTAIPEDGSVKIIGEGAFSGRETLTAVKIPYGVTEIGGCAFSSCKALTSVSIPSSVTRIGELAFSSCEALTTVLIPEGVTCLEGHLFSSCKALRSVHVPGNVAAISPTAFDGCKEIMIYTPRRSFTWQWAEKNRIPVLDDIVLKQSHYQAMGLCRRCGGTFKGLFRKKCASCGYPKDY